METIAKIRRAYFRDKKPITQICRELRVSRNTVRGVIRSGATEFGDERSVQPQPKIGPWKDELDRMPAENARKSKRDRLTVIRIFEELQALRYESGYDAVRRYAASWARTEREASAAMCGRPLEASDFFGTIGHVIRCGRVFGLVMRPLIRRGPLWRYAGRVQFAYPRSVAHRRHDGFPDPVS